MLEPTPLVWHCRWCRLWAWDPVRHARDVGGVVAAMTRLVVAVREDGQMTLGLRCGELWLRAGFVEGVATSVELQVKRLLLDSAADALCARVALAATGMS